MSTNVKYNNTVITTLPYTSGLSSMKTLKTAGTVCATDIEINHDSMLNIFISRFGRRSELTYYSNSTITTITSWAFASCGSLSSVSLPNVTSIGMSAFGVCANLTELNFPNLTYAGSYAFANCTKVSTISLPNLTGTSNNAFQTMTALTSVYLPNLTSIATTLFTFCSGLSIATFPKVASIGNGAFNNCISLAKLYLMSTTMCTLSTSSIFSATPMISSGYLGYFGSIYVPNSLLATYRADTVWSWYIDRFVGVYV